MAEDIQLEMIPLSNQAKPEGSFISFLLKRENGLKKFCWQNFQL